MRMQRLAKKSDVSSTVTSAPESNARVLLVELLSTCIDAVKRGGAEIRRVQNILEREDGKVRGVEYKIKGDVRSALTAADLAAQAAIEESLKAAWPCLTLVCEEDLAGDITEAAGGAVCNSDVLFGGAEDDGIVPLRHDLCAQFPQLPEHLVSWDRIAVYVDPLDGTREFVEGRLSNVQTLVGIAVDGRAVAGAVGIPFAESGVTVVYALVGAGIGMDSKQCKAVHPERAPSCCGPDFREEANGRPVLVAGDTRDPVLAAAYASALEAGGSQEQLGGTGQKILAVAEDRADIAIMNFKSNRWDTCAPEALIRTVGGELTDLFGEQIVYCTKPPPPASHLNACGVVASSRTCLEKHLAVCAAMRKNPDALQLLKPWGLNPSMSKAEDVARVLRERRALLSTS